MKIRLGQLKSIIREAIEESTGTTNAVVAYSEDAPLEEDDGGGGDGGSGDSSGYSGLGWGGGGYGMGGGSSHSNWSVDDPSNKDLLDFLFP